MTEPDPTEEAGDPAAVGAAGEPEAWQPRRYPSTIGGAFYLAILLTACTAIGIVASGDWRLGVRVLAAGLAAAALLRLVLPHRDAGMLAVRHRVLDVLILAGVAVALYWLAGSIPDQPG